MKKVQIKQGQVLHKKGDEVRSIEIVLSGRLSMSDGNCGEIVLESGAMTGIIYNPGDIYSFDYIATADSILATFDYINEDTIAAAVAGMPTIAPIIAGANMSFVKAMLDKLAAIEEEAVSTSSDMKFNYNDYKFLCVKLDKEPAIFPYIEELTSPEPSGMVDHWEANTVQAFCEQHEELKKNYYALNNSFCVDTVMRAAEIGQHVRTALEDAAYFIKEVKLKTDDFVRAYYDVKSRVDSQNRGNSAEAPVITDALEVILSFSGVKSEIADAFRKDIKTFIDAPDRRSLNDDMRRLRMNIAKNYYDIYEAAFFRSMKDNHIPVEVRMFFLFGFVDEELAGSNNTQALYNLAVRWENDPEDRILPIYEWLVKIYKGEALPSKNEFDNDWFEYLRESVRTATMTQDHANEIQDDRSEMVKFEIHNMFKTANRITNGTISTFVPVFSAQDVVRAMDKCLADPKRISEALNKVLEIDFSCFYREAVVEYPEFKIQRFVYNVEVKPYILLMPNFGARGMMWQEIEGARRTTPAHMLISIFHSEDIDETFVRMCAQFRWEMCRRIQGVRYTDISERSLTSEYVNYLQFYKKNGYLSNEVKEHIKIALQKARNDYKNVFISEYEKYILNEAHGLPRLNKIARDILYRYCTLSKKYRMAMAINPQFKPLIERWSVKQSQKVHSIDLIVQKIRKMNPNDEIPKEIAMEAEFSRM